MYISAEVDNEEIFGYMLQYIFTQLPSKSKVVIAREFLESLSLNVLRDKVQLAIRYDGDKEFVPCLKEAIDKEKNPLLKKMMEETLKEIEG